MLCQQMNGRMEVERVSAKVIWVTINAIDFANRPIANLGGYLVDKDSKPDFFGMAMSSYLRYHFFA